MSGDRTGGGDPARTLALLWRATAAGGPRRGRPPALSVDRVVDEAIAVADAEGLDAVTMRRLATALGVGPMTLYTYVPGKSELLDLMLDAAYARMPRPAWAGAPWRTRVAAVAEANRDLLAAHPWAASVSTSRPPLGPGQMAKYEHELRAFEETGLDDLDMDAALTFVLDFVRATALARAGAERARRDTGMSDEEWWNANAPLLERVLDAEAFPTAARVGAAAGAAQGGAVSPDVAWRFGLARVLDGLGALID